MSRLDDLIAAVREDKPELAEALADEFHSRTDRTFGLVFEKHLPETVELYGRPVRRGDTVRILPERGDTKTKKDNTIWTVMRTHRAADGTKKADIARMPTDGGGEPEVKTGFPVDDLVVVAGHTDTIYPGLRKTGEVIETDDPDAPVHTVINAENFHALKLLTYTHYHAVDCIYIDPPYNTGAKDWKYNNNYVDGTDGYRHSKWLSFMQRRLEIARKLLKPDNSVLIVTIDEKEYLRLGLLLEQTFPEARIQMVTSVITPAGSRRKSELSRTDEYIYFVMFGDAAPQKTLISTLTREENIEDKKIDTWITLRRSADTREKSPNLFYPIYVDPDTLKILGAGNRIDGDVTQDKINCPDGAVAILPILDDGTESGWQVSNKYLYELMQKGYVRAMKYNGGIVIHYLKGGTQKHIEKGNLILIGRDKNGVVKLEQRPDYSPEFFGNTTWYIKSHAAHYHGTMLLKKFLGGEKRFTFPKSLYAVEDALRFFVKDKPDATIVDFFAGSGTTAHAVMRLNKQDGGRRKSISVTNNEVSVTEDKKLRKQGYRPGDPEWEKWGVCEYVTKPRITAAITGLTPQGNPVKGDYTFTDTFPMKDGFKDNAAFYTLTYEPPTKVQHGMAFPAIAPLLWLRAGQKGRVIDRVADRGWDVAPAYGVLFNPDTANEFIAELKQRKASGDPVALAYVVTSDDTLFESVSRDIMETGADVVRLYSTYLNNFAFTNQD